MNQTNKIEQTERLKLELFSLEFRQCLKSEQFDNRTISKSAEIQTLGFQTLTVYILGNQCLKIEYRTS